MLCVVYIVGTWLIFMEFGKECFGVTRDWSFSSSCLLTWGFCLAEGCFFGWEKVVLDSTASSPLIVVRCDLWGSWFWPGYAFNFWLLRFLISSSNSIKLTMLLNKAKCFHRLNQWKTDFLGVDSMMKVLLYMFSLKYSRFAGHLCSYPPTGMIRSCNRLQYLLRK